MFNPCSVAPRSNMARLKESQKVDQATRERLLRMVGAHEVRTLFGIVAQKLMNPTERHGEPSALDRGRGTYSGPYKLRLPSITAICFSFTACGTCCGFGAQHDERFRRWIVSETDSYPGYYLTHICNSLAIRILYNYVYFNQTTEAQSNIRCAISALPYSRGY